MKKIACMLLSLFKFIVVLTSLWLVVEIIHYKITNDYFLYYKLWLREANNAADEIYIINQVFNVRDGRLPNVFSNYFLPAIMGLSIPIFIVDTLIALNNKKYILSYIVYSIAVLVLFGIIFIH
mgnify:CR=1 FL=1